MRDGIGIRGEIPREKLDLGQLRDSRHAGIFKNSQDFPAAVPCFPLLLLLDFAERAFFQIQLFPLDFPAHTLFFGNIFLDN